MLKLEERIITWILRQSRIISELHWHTIRQVFNRINPVDFSQATAFEESKACMDKDSIWEL